MSEDVNFARELRIDEALEVTRAAPRILTGMSFALVILLANAGPFWFWGWTSLSSGLIVFMIFLAMRNYFKFRNKPRPADVSHKRIQSFLIFAVVMGIGWGSLVAMAVFTEDRVTQTVGLLLAFIGTFATTNINSVRVVVGFGAVTLFIAYVAVMWAGLLPPIGATVAFFLAIVTITYFSQQAQRHRVASIRLTMANVQALQERLESEEKLRLAQIEASEQESARQREVSDAQRNLINAIPFPLVLARSDTPLEITPVARECFGVPDDSALEDIRLSSFFVDPETPQKILDLVQEQGELNDFETIMHDGSGSQFWVTVSIRSLSYQGEKCWLNAIYVIDARKRMEQELEVARDKAEVALEDLRKAQDQLVHSEKMASLGQLTAGVAHEIKNPLNFVNNFSKISADMMDELAELLADPIQSLEEDDREDAEDLLQTVKDNLVKIDSHGSRADSIIKNMLAHSREGSGEMSILPLNRLVDEALHLAYHGTRAADQSVEIELETVWSDEEEMVRVNPQEVQRVFMNICTNGIYAATKHQKALGGKAKLTVTSAVKDDALTVRVQDNGPGIPKDIQKEIFQPFFTTKPAGEGTGLGLSMSFDIIKAHGGTIELESEDGAGAAFIVTLPKAHSDEGIG